jgi:hypothetical protein
VIETKEVPFKAFNLGLVQIEAFLNKYNRSPQSLLAAWSMSKDFAFLEEALLRFPDEPSIMFAAIANSLGDRHELLLNLIKNDADNALAYMIASTSATERMDYVQVINWLQTASQAAVFNDYSDEVRRWIKTAATESGLDDKKASAYAAMRGDIMKNNLEYYIQIADEAANMMSQQFVDPNVGILLKKSIGDLADYLMDDRPGSSLLYQVAGDMLREKINAGLREAVEKDANWGALVSTSETTGVYKEDLVNIKKQFNELDWFRHASDENTIEFYNLVFREGEQAAVRWAVKNPPVNMRR